MVFRPRPGRVEKYFGLGIIAAGLFLLVQCGGVPKIGEEVLDDYPPFPPTLNSPFQASDVQSNPPTLSVNNSIDPEEAALTYTFEIYSDQNLTQLVASATAVSQTSEITSWTVTQALNEDQWYYWRARSRDGANDSPWMAAVSFRLNAVNSAPGAPGYPALADGTEVTSQAVGLEIGPASDPDGKPLYYEFQADTAEDFSSANLIASGNLTDPFWLTPALADNTLWFWRARALDNFGTALAPPGISYAPGEQYLEGPWSGIYSFFVNTANDAPAAPALDSPSDGGNVSSLTLAVRNSADPDRDALTYEFQVSGASDFATVLAQRSGLPGETGGVTGWTISPLLPNGTYYWRCRASDGAAVSSWAGSRTFHFALAQNDAPAAPVLSSPAPGDYLDTLTPTLTVQNASDPDGGALTYEFQVSLNVNFSSWAASVSRLAAGAGTTSWTVSPALTDGTSYYWRARAFDGSLDGAWSETRHFVIDSNNVPAALTQAATVTAGNGEVNLTWTYAKPADFKNFVIRRSLTTGTGYTEIAATAANSFRDIGLTNGTTYFYVVAAVDQLGRQSANSPEAAAQPKSANTVPGSPMAQTPAAGAYLSSLTPSLTVQNAVDPDGDPLTYEFQVSVNINFSPVWALTAGIAPGVGTTTWTVGPALTDGTICYWRARAYDGALNGPWSEVRSFTTDTNGAPSAAALALIATAGDKKVDLSWTYTPPSDFDHYRVFRSPNSGAGPYTWLSDVNATSYQDVGLTNGTPYYYVIQVVDHLGRTSGNSPEASANPSGGAGNNAPGLNLIGNRGINENQLLEFTISATDPDGNPLVYYASNLPAGASFDSLNRRFSWTPNYEQAGTYPAVWFGVSDGALTDSEGITVTVANVNRAPVLNPIGSKTVNEAELLEFTISGADPDGGSGSFSANDLPAGASFNGLTGVFSWTPGYTQAGQYLVEFAVSDGDLSDQEGVTVTVLNTNRYPEAPTLSSPGAGAFPGTLTPSLEVINPIDPDGDALTYDFQVSEDINFMVLTASVLGVSEGVGTTTWAVSPALTDGTVYYWRSRAFDGLLSGPWTEVCNFTTDLNGVPEAFPQAPTATAGDKTVNLSWGYDKPADFNHFRVLRSPTSGGPYAWLSDTTADSFLDGGLTNGTPYYYVLQAVDGLGRQSGNSPEAYAEPVSSNVAPGAPTSQSPAIGTYLVSLIPSLTVQNATDPEGDTLTYEFQVAGDLNFSTVVASAGGIASGPGTTSWTVSPALTDRTLYFWRARAHDGVLNGPWTQVWNFTPDTNGIPPAFPQAPTATAGDKNVALAWIYTPPSDFDHYRVLRSGTSGGPYAWVSDATTNSYLDGGLTNGTTYYYVIQAADQLGRQSADSPQAQATPEKPNSAPGAPVNSAPILGDYLPILGPTLEVENSSDPDFDALTYEFQVSLDIIFSEPVTRSVIGVAEETLTTTWDVTPDLADGTNYYWRARASDGFLNGPWSEVWLFTTDTNGFPEALTQAPVASPGNTIVNLSWTYTRPDDFGRFRILRSEASGGPYSWVADTTGNIFRDTGLANGTMYYYVIVVEDRLGRQSGNSPEASAQPGNLDTDGDGMPDSWETGYFGNLSRNGTGDFDSDGLVDLEEFNYGADPTDQDSDDDLLNDGPEVNTCLTNPLDPDSDNDGLTDYEEVCYDGNCAYNPYGPASNPTGTDTNAKISDTDQDGWRDWDEVQCSANPIDPASFCVVEDKDGDGYGVNVDCDDNNPYVNPGRPEICGNGIDDNCNGACRHEAECMGLGAGLSGEYIYLGINPDNSLVTYSPYYAGLEYDPDGYGSGESLDDWLYPGMPQESWSFEYNGTENFHNNSPASGSDVVMSMADISSGSENRALGGGQAGDLLITQIVNFSDDDRFVVFTVIIENPGAVTATQVKYLRNADPDIDSYTYEVEQTENDVSAPGLVLARGPVSGYVLGLGSWEAGAVASAEGFDVRDPDEILDTPEDPEGMADDLAINLAVSLGTLEPGDRVSFNFYYFAGANTQEVVDLHNLLADDWDGDGLSNSLETATYFTDPRRADTDADGLTDVREINVYGTNPLAFDSDADGVSDGLEVELGRDPRNPADPPATDSDGDTLPDWQELMNQLNPSVKDSDGDGLEDNVEMGASCTDPRDNDSDGDGLSDGEEVVTEGTDPWDNDSDDDGLADGIEVNTYGTDPLQEDSDGDHYSDRMELETGSDPNSAGSTPPLPPRVKINEIETGSDWIELLNTEAYPVGITNWIIRYVNYSTYDLVLPAFVLEAGAHVVVDRNCGDNTATRIHICDSFGWCGPNQGSAALLNHAGRGVDFVRWSGSSDLPPEGTAWSESLPINFPCSDPNTLQRRPLGMDSDTEADWTVGVSTPEEVNNTVDWDQDGLPDWGEIQTTETDPGNWDTDGDLISDGDEVDLGTDPLNSNDPDPADDDGDGISTYAEVNIYGTDFETPDSDGDGLADGEEVTVSGTDPRNDDSDGDGLIDGVEVDTCGTDPWNVDSDGDGLTDAEELDPYGTNPLNPDTDGDGYPDQAEISWGSDPDDLLFFPGAGLEGEPNNSNTDCTWIEAISPRDEVFGTIGAVGDYDYYCFTSVPGHVLRFDIEANEYGSPLDSTLYLYDQDWNGWGMSYGYDLDSGWDNDPHMISDITSSGINMLRVSDYGNNEGGSSYWYFLKVEDLSATGEVDLAESEPDDTVSTCDSVGVVGTEKNIFGVVDFSYDDDFYCFEAATGSIISFDIDAEEYGSFLDSYLILYDRDGNTVLNSADDSPDPDSGYPGADSHFVHAFQTSGTYCLSVADLDVYDYGPEYWYFLQITDLSHAGEVYTEESETNNNLPSCNPVGLMDPEEIVLGAINPVGDTDFYCLPVTVMVRTAGVDLEALEYGSALDAAFTLYDRDGETVLASSLENADPDTGYSGDPYLTYSFPVTGIYYLRVVDEGGNGGPEYWYFLRFRDITDSDADGLPDREEGEHGCNPFDPDSDNDGVADGDEVFIYETSPTNPDSDTDGLTDAEELWVYGTLPANPDSDGDGLEDGDEVSVFVTEPAVDDSDDDGLSDGEEVCFDLNCGSYTPGEDPDPNDPDSDDDGLSDGDELDALTDPLDSDSDDDGYNDWLEIENGSNPNNIAIVPDLRLETEPNDSRAECVPLGYPTPITQAFGWIEGVEEEDWYCLAITTPVTIWADVDSRESGSVLDSYLVLADETTFLAEDNDSIDPVSGYLGTDSHIYYSLPVTGVYYLRVSATNGTLGWYYLRVYDASDADLDGLARWQEMTVCLTDPNDADSDGDGLTDGEEVLSFDTDPLDSGDPDSITDYDLDGVPDWWETNVYGTFPYDSDSDNDGLTDGEELNTYFSDPLVADGDGDGLLDGEEIAAGSDPGISDSDSDGLLDGDEVHVYGSNPNDPDSDDDGYSDLAEGPGGSDPNQGASIPDLRFEAEPNDDPAGCNWLEFPGPVTMAFGSVGESAESDYYCLAITMPVTISFDVEADEYGSPLDSYLQVIEGETTLAWDDNSADPDTNYDGLDSHLAYSFAVTGTYYIRVRDAYANGGADYWYFLRVTDVADTDTDGDGLTDWWEMHVTGTDPNDADMDDDGLSDGQEICSDGDCGSYNSLSDTDPVDMDSDNDLLSDWEEVTGSTGYVTFPLDDDSDNDSRLDGQEIAAGSNPLNAGSLPPTVASPQTLTDASGYSWDILNLGYIGNGSVNGIYDSFDNAFRLYINGTSSPAYNPFLLESGNREMVLGPTPWSIAGLNVIRKVYVPSDDSFARYLEILRNPTANPITVSVRIYGDLYDSSSTGIVATSSGDTAFNTDDTYLVTDDSCLDCNFHSVALVFDGIEGRVDVNQTSQTGDVFNYYWNNVTVPPGETVILMHFSVQNSDRAVTQARAHEIQALTGSTTSHLLNMEKVNIYNWGVPVDFDTDGLSNQDEINLYGTDPYDIDTDDDSLSDYTETQVWGTDPLDPNDPNPGQDTDGDSLPDEWETNVFGTDPADADTDDDSLDDGEEVNTYATDPLNPDTDADHLNDGDEIDNSTNPKNSDCDEDSYGDGLEVLLGSGPNDSDSVPSAGLSETFETGAPGWTAVPLWNLYEEGEISHYYYYGQAGVWDYNTGGINSGELVSPEFPVPVTVPVYLAFRSWEDTECNGVAGCGYDARQVSLSTDGGTNWDQIWQSDNLAYQFWYEPLVNLTIYAGQEVMLKFDFNTFDALNNGFEGWYIDDVRILGGP